MKGAMNLANIEIRSEMRRLFITNKELCRAIGINAVSMSKWLANPLTEEREKRVKEAMGRIIKQRMEVTNHE